ncbi:hypothetical protein ABID50_000625 [Streptococcus parasuis]|jgi:hypothetical protein|uniref:Uncharacterized protein n=1 Tax=Streptococcus parasuis TaxID=1501662 RepID=A0ABV2EQS3_9STRE
MQNGLASDRKMIKMFGLILEVPNFFVFILFLNTCNSLLKTFTT